MCLFAGGSCRHVFAVCCCGLNSYSWWMNFSWAFHKVCSVQLLAVAAAWPWSQHPYHSLSCILVVPHTRCASSHVPFSPWRGREAVSPRACMLSRELYRDVCWHWCILLAPCICVWRGQLCSRSCAHGHVPSELVSWRGWGAVSPIQSLFIITLLFLCMNDVMSSIQQMWPFCWLRQK